MFIHFGLYSLPARHEWIKTMERISEEKYDKYFNHFNPDLFDAKEWAKRAKEAGMKYAVLTTKHHEGFCLFDSKFTDYKATNTPCGKDIVKEYVDAFRAEGIKIGFYYSLIDWHHPHFPIDVIHPRREDKNGAELDKGRDVRIYAEYMRNQVTELLTNYGKIDVIWFDFSYPEADAVKMLAFDKGNPPPDPNKKPWMQGNGGKCKDDWESEKLMALIRSLQPDIVINNRLGIEGDTVTPEQSQPTSWIKDANTGEYLTWEVCHTFSGSWGYFRDEMTWKSPKMLIDTLIKTVAYGGNLLMNVGPTSRGVFDQRANLALDAFADWMKYNSRSIYG
jgi:alpha-L-fucosidase